MLEENNCLLKIYIVIFIFHPFRLHFTHITIFTGVSNTVTYRGQMEWVLVKPVAIFGVSALPEEGKMLIILSSSLLFIAHMNMRTLV